MSLTSQIADYNPDWTRLFDEEAARLRAVFGYALREIHHVGSTAVFGLAAKPEIDVLVVVSSDAARSDWAPQLLVLGYRRGGDLSAGHQFYKKDIRAVRTHKIHVCVEGHGEIQRMLTFRNELRTNAVLKTAYQTLKLDLERTNTSGIGEYLKKKAPFIEEVLRVASLGKLGEN